MPADVRVKAATFGVGVDRVAEMERFYRGSLGLRQGGGVGLRVAVGDADLSFEPRAGAPFHHFALLVPGDRFDAARAWLAERAPLLTRPGDDRTVFEFGAWNARACYVHDPAGNIVELIAHSGIAEAGGDGAFDPGELRAISEVGLVVGDTAAAAHTLDSSGVPLWFGDVGGEDELGFAGRQAHTLILCPVRRPWLPTRRPAQACRVEVTLATAAGTDVTVRTDDLGTLDVVRPEPG